MKRAALILFFEIFAATSVVAANQTPRQRAVFLFQPYEFGSIGHSGEQVIETAEAQGYEVTEARQRSVGTQTPTDANLTVYENQLDDGFGVWFQSSHGSGSGCAVEVYENSAAGEAARNNNFNFYIAHGYRDGTDIYRASSQDGHHISITPSRIAVRYIGRNSIVYNQTCKGHRYESTAWPGSRVRLGYNNDITMGNAETQLIWYRLNGSEGKTKRTIANARGGLTIQCAGHENTVLAPCIQEIYPASGTSLLGDVSGWVIFDTEMDTSSDPNCLVRCDGWVQGGVVPRDVRWFGNAAIYYTLHPFKTGAAPLAVSASCARAKDGGQPIDGNGDPPGTDGVGPNRDNYRVVYDSRVNDPSLEARFEGTWAWSEADGIHLGWITDGERGSAAMEVLADGALVASVPASGAPDRSHYYETTVPGGAVFSIRERDCDPGTLDEHSRPFVAGGPPDSLESLRSLNARMAALPTVPLTDPSSYEYRGGEPPVAYYTDLVFYSSRQDFLDLTQPVRNALQVKGLSSQTVLGSPNPLEARARYAEIWQRAVQEQRPNPPFLVIVGEAHSATDHPDWNIVGTIILSDPGGDCYFGNNCATDQLLVDADGDSLADGPVSRINVKTIAELANVNGTTLDLYNNTHLSSPRALFLVGDLAMCVPVDEPRATCATIRGWYAAKGLPTIWLLDSNYSNCYDFTSRYNDAKAAVNSAPGITELCGLGYLTNRSVWPGYFFQKTSNPVFNPSDLTRVQRIVVELIGCGTNDGDRANPSYYPSIAKAITVANPATGTTAAAALGNTRAGFETTHLMLARAYFQERLYGYNWCVQQAFFKATRQIGEGQVGLRHYLLLSESYGYPAWLPGMLSPSGVEPGGAQAEAMSVASIPIPTGASSNIRFTLPHLTKASVNVYSVAGRRVLELSTARVWPAGRHEVTWDGNDASSRPVASGVYFVRVETEESSVSTKVVIAR